MRVTRRLEVPYPQEAVFDFLADVRNEERWHPDVSSVELEGDTPIETGTKFRVHYRRLGLVELEIVEFARPRQVVFRATGATKAVYQTRLEASGGGTKIVTVADAQARGLGRILSPLLRGRIQKDFQRRGQLLAAGLAEQLRTGEART